MEGKSSVLILLFIVAFLSLTLAVLAGYVFFVAGTPRNSADASSEAKKQEEMKKPKEEELYKLQLFEEKKYLNLKSDDPKKMSIIQIGIIVKCHKFKEKDDKKVEAKIKPYVTELQEAAIAYFGNITLEDARNQTATMEKAKKDLVEKFNQIIPKDEKEKKSVVYSVVFYDWFTQ
ncbi:MAG: flagellar basal body-associated FliL family protein [Clostridia bacterium]|nr:flagellar basal body-associated FliL family protein [Clostridia bacterium]